MLTLRGNFASQVFVNAVKTSVGVAMPKVRAIVTEGDRSLAWMSPDEVLLILPHAELAAVRTRLTEALAGEHALVVDVSDARAVLTVSGAGAREVLAKLCPVDLAPDAFGPGEMRRTRAAQVAAAIWMSGEEEFTLIAFRSVAGYVMGLLTAAAAPGGEVGVFA
ncbi:sarcosine oxidase subunit gamma [Allgaiera indica]|nr:sarcosine oxidase subunit gamma family protein [Allgaiera indica]